MTCHFIASSGSTMLNSRPSVAAYGASEKSPGRTAAPMRMWARSAVCRSVAGGAADTATNSTEKSKPRESEHDDISLRHVHLLNVRQKGL